ncbi:hypothetical protein [Sphingomonas sp.]|uniref:hypothetical protein n=1 Tax=Sphingomonas sp. TaxID=28214 RepID=UPI003BA9908D
MREMLTQSSFESFRVSTLDLMSRLTELLDTLQAVEETRLPMATIEPVLAEVLASLKSDPVARTVVQNEIEILAGYKRPSDLKKPEAASLFGLGALLIKRVGSDYGHKLESAILECYGDKQRRNRLRQSCSAYCSYLVNIGYSKKHLVEIIDQRFFSEDIGKIEKRTLQRFFTSLSKVDRQFRIWVAAPATTANFISKLGLEGFDVHTHRNLPADVRAAFGAKPGFAPVKRYISRCIEAKDRYSAVGRLSQSLASIDSFVILGRESIDLTWDDQAYVRTPRATQGEFLSGDVFSLQGPTRPVKGGAARIVRSQARRAMSNFDEPSTERLLSAVNTAALARTSPNLENHLISLWSAIEVLLSNPPAGVPRIIHYVDLLAPCICSKYVRRYIVAIYDAIHASYTAPFTRLIRGLALPVEVDEYTRFTHIAFDPAFKGEQTALLAMLSGNPLALHRLWKLENNFGRPSAYSSALLSHEERVRWQLHRIYRTRNQLVHSGSVPVYLEPLVLNMLEYFRSTIGPVIGRASKEENLADIDQMVSEIGVDFQIVKRRVASYGKPEFDVSDYPFFYR